MKQRTVPAMMLDSALYLIGLLGLFAAYGWWTGRIEDPAGGAWFPFLATLVWVSIPLAQWSFGLPPRRYFFGRSPYYYDVFLGQCFVVGVLLLAGSFEIYAGWSEGAFAGAGTMGIPLGIGIAGLSGYTTVLRLRARHGL